MVYLTDPVRARPNLDIRDRTQVDRVVIEDARVTGVRLVGGEVVEAGEVILCAGAYGSPLILMRSGIGPGADLAALGIPVLADLPVGQGLRDHPVYFSTYTLRRASGVPHPAAGAALSIPSKEALDGDLDLWVFVYNMKLPRWLPVRPTLMLGTSVMRPLSRGHVKLRSSDPRDKPIIDVQLLSDASDRRRILEGVRLAGALARQAPLADLIAHESAPGVDLNDEEALMQVISENLATFDHGCCTVPMGRDDNPSAVTDRSGSVRGVDGLRVVDASIFPDTVSVPINLTVLMLAERIAAGIRGESAKRPATQSN